MKGVTGRLMRRFSLASLTAAVLITAIPSGASAATQIGQTFPPESSNCSANTWLQSGAPGGQYTVPSDGVITSWSFEANSAPPELKFKVGRHAPGADLTMAADFTIIGESGLVAPDANTLTSYFIRIPVQAGDVIGAFFNDDGDCGRSDSDYDYHQFPADVQPGDTQTFTPATGFQFDVSALLEPDCDKDGLGDETQDNKLVGSCSTLTCKGEPLTDVGTDGPDEILGTTDRDVIAALGGRDKVSGLAGKDLICGGRGRDTLKGGKSKDKLFGQKGRDKLRGGGGKDVCKGGKGDDTASKCEVEKSI
jgi:hypothetical protein